MKVYAPQIKVLLIKSRHRSKIIGNIPAAQNRYQKFDGIDLTPMLGDGSSVSTTKSVRMPMGAFSIRIMDKPHAEFMETIYGLVEPMDIIEIRMAHESTGKMPLVMRGFVSQVDRSESMQGNRPSRFVTITGHDFAKLMQIYRITYLFYTEMADKALATFRFFQAYAPNGGDKSMAAGDFVNMVVNEILTPYMAGITSLSKADAVGAKAINRWSVQSTISGRVNPFTISRATDVSLHGLMASALDVGAFNEMYVEDWEDGPVLFVRPVPFKNGQDEFIQGVANSVSIPSVDIMSVNSSRSDAGVANYFWVNSQSSALLGNTDYRARAIAGDPSSFVKFDGLNCARSLFGIRKMDVAISLEGDSVAVNDSSKESAKAQQVSHGLSWIESRRKILAEMNQDNVVFESGHLRLRGNEKIKAGVYLNISRGVNQSGVGEVYAHTVTHEFMVNNAFYTTVQFDRGTGFIERAQRNRSMYLDEIEAQGAV